MPQKYFDIVEGLKYDPRQQDQIFNMIYADRIQRGKAFEETARMIPEAQAIYESTPVTPDNIDYLNQSASKLKSDLSGLLEKHGGDYGDPAFIREASARIQSTKSDIIKLTRDYQDYKQYEPIRAKLAQQGKLIDLKPQSTAIFQNGKYQPYNWSQSFLERPDRTDYVRKNFSAIGDTITEYINSKSELSPEFYESVKKKGIGALTERDWNNIVSDKDVEKFVNETFYEVDLQTKGSDPKEAIKEIANSIWGTHVIQSPDWQQAQSLRNKNVQNYNQQILSQDITTRAAINPNLIEGKGYVDSWNDYKNTSLGASGMSQTGTTIADLKNVKSVKEAINKIKTHKTLIEEKLKEYSSVNIGENRDPKDATRAAKKVGMIEALKKINMQLEAVESFDSDIAAIKDIWIAKQAGKETKEDIKDPEQYGKLVAEANSKPDEFWMNILDADEELLKMRTYTSNSILNPGTREYLKDLLNSNLVDKKFRLDGKKTASSYIGDIAKELNVEMNVIDNYLKENNYFNYNQNTGEVFIDIPKKYNKDGKPLRESGVERVFFNLDDVTLDIQNKLKQAEQAINTNTETEIVGGNFKYIYDPNIKGLKSDPNIKRFKYVNLVTGEINYRSLRDIQATFKNYFNNHLKENYTPTKPDKDAILNTSNY